MSSHHYVGALDQGTTSTRFNLFDRQGEIVARAQKEHAQICPKPGWLEHDAQEFWSSAQEVMRMALQRAAVSPRDLAAIGITNQRETTLLWDRASGLPLHHAIVWQDTRVDALVEDYARAGGPDRFRTKTGIPLASYFSALKLQWLLDHVPGARAKAARGEVLFGTMDSWLVRPRVIETTALGAAYAAGLAVGYWSEPGELKDKWRIDRRWRSAVSATEREHLYRYWGKAVRRSLDWID